MYGENYEDESWDETSPGRRWGLIAFVTLSVLVLVAGVAVTVFGLGRESPSTRPAAQVAPTDSPAAIDTPSPTPEVTTPPPTTAAATPSRTPSRRPKSTDLPPAPKPKVTNTVNCPTFPFAPATNAAIKAELKRASTHTYWKSFPAIKVPERLLQATAWTESSWRQAVLACDGGQGLMQLMPDTVKQVNLRFGVSWNASTLSGNVNAGANYLAWSIKYLGDTFYGGSYDLAGVVNGISLLDATISAYNNGAGAVFPDQGTAGITNWSYVNAVKGNMQSCPCDAY
jgi:soluble lytic murein transglycosylase-like protein